MSRFIALLLAGLLFFAPLLGLTKEGSQLDPDGATSAASSASDNGDRGGMIDPNG